MDKEMIKDKIERLRILAEDYLKNDIRVYIVDINNEWYFADILFVGEDRLTIQCFSPQQKAGNKYSLRWPSIIKFEEYKG